MASPALFASMLIATSSFLQVHWGTIQRSTRECQCCDNRLKHLCPPDQRNNLCQKNAQCVLQEFPFLVLHGTNLYEFPIAHHRSFGLRKEYFNIYELSSPERLKIRTARYSVPIPSRKLTHRSVFSMLSTSARTRKSTMLCWKRPVALTLFLPDMH